MAIGLRLNPKERKAKIMTAAIRTAKRVGYMQMRREDVATMAGCSNSLVSAYWGSVPQLRRAVMRHAVRIECLEVIAQGLAAKDRHALKAPVHVKMAAAATL